MKLATTIICFIAGVVLSAPVEQDERKCLAVCHIEKPRCKPGEKPTGGPGCWGCCHPVIPKCLQVCHLEMPECEPGEAPTGGPGCWGCCVPIKESD